MLKSRLVLLARLFLVLTATACHAATPCRTLRPDPAALAARRAVRAANGVSGVALRASVKSETQLNVVDVLVAYDRSACNWLAANGKGTPDAYARAKVAEMNACLVNSRITEFTFRLVGTVCIGVDATQYRDRYGAVDLEAILSEHLVDAYGNVCATGEWKKITDQREALGADVVSMLVSAGDEGVVGMGYSLEDSLWDDFSTDPASIPSFGDWAYSICSIDITDGDHSMLHEIGHNMGCGHADASVASGTEMDLGPQLYSYSAASYLWIGGEGYYTIMGYNFGGLRPNGSYNPFDRFTELPYFSSPVLYYGGVALGSKNHDNRRTLLNTYAYVAQYRASKLSPGQEPEVGPEPPPGIFSTEFRPTKAVKDVAPYIGAVREGEKLVGLLSLRCGRPALTGNRAGKCKVTATVRGLDGKVKKSKAVDVACGYDATAEFDIKDWGKLSLTLGGEGFVGTMGANRTVKTEPVGGAWTNARSRVDVNFGPGMRFLPEGTRVDLLPTGDGAEPVRLVNGKWGFAKAATVKWTKPKGATEKELVVDVGTNGEKANRSGMKLTYLPKKGTFRGSFKVYALVDAGSDKKLVKYRVAVTGIVAGGVGRGAAVLKRTGGTWDVVVDGGN